MKLRPAILLVAFLAIACSGARDGVTISTAAPWSVRIADSFLMRHPDATTWDSASPNQRWNYEQGLMLVALLRTWRHTGDNRYFEFVRKNLDRYVGEDGTIGTYRLADYNLDNVGPGRALLEVYGATRQVRYRLAADLLRRQLREQPRTAEGGFWHKQIYPHQMWLDGLFMAEPFYGAYADSFGEQSVFDDIAGQFIRIAAHTRDSATGLFYHGWDESGRERWAAPGTGCSPSFWGRGMGWYAMALVDVLDGIPPGHGEREVLIGILQNLADALVKYEDPKTHLWYQVVDQGSRPGNYREASVSCMLAYAFARGARKGYLGEKYFSVAEQTFNGVIDSLVTIDKAGLADLHGTCRGAGLGGSPYRDGSYAYYIGEPQRTNDMKGIGPFLMAAVELEEGMAAAGRTER